MTAGPPDPLPHPREFHHRDVLPPVTWFRRRGGVSHCSAATRRRLAPAGRAGHGLRVPPLPTTKCPLTRAFTLHYDCVGLLAERETHTALRRTPIPKCLIAKTRSGRDART